MLVPLMLVSSMVDAAQAVQGFGLSALKRAGASLTYFAIGYGALVVAAVPVAKVWGLPGLWVSMIVMNVLLLGLQGHGFWKHSGRIGERVGNVPAGA